MKTSKARQVGPGILERRAIVVGAGIGGLSAAAALTRIGMQVDILECASEARGGGAGIGIMANAVTALRSLGIDDALESAGQVVEDFHIRSERGRLLASMPLKEVSDELGAPSVSIERAALHGILTAAAQGARLHLGARCERFEIDARSVRAHTVDGRCFEADVLIGADGLHSTVRRQMTGPEPTRYAGYICWLATIPFRHPRMTRGYVGHYWGRGKRFGLVDVGQGNTYWWATQNQPERASEPGTALARAAQCVEGWADEVVQAVASTRADQVLEVAARDRPFLSRWGRGRMTLLGDAAHPMLTSLGQGGCMAIEDAVVLGRCLSGNRELVAGLREYEALRRARTRRMVQTSRVMSAIEQLQHPVPVALRDTYFRMQPRRVAREQARSIMSFADHA